MCNQGCLLEYGHHELLHAGGFLRGFKYGFSCLHSLQHGWLPESGQVGLPSPNVNRMSTSGISVRLCWTTVSRTLPRRCSGARFYRNLSRLVHTSSLDKILADFHTSGGEHSHGTCERGCDGLLQSVFQWRGGGGGHHSGIYTAFLRLLFTREKAPYWALLFSSSWQKLKNPLNPRFRETVPQRK